jgi:hypothetical protein
MVCFFNRLLILQHVRDLCDFYAVQTMETTIPRLKGGRWNVELTVAMPAFPVISANIVSFERTTYSINITGIATNAAAPY